MTYQTSTYMKKLLIKEIAREKGVTIAELAKRLGITEQSVRNSMCLENLRLDSLMRYADALGVPVWRLFVTPDEAARYVPKGDPAAILTCPRCGLPLRVTLE